ncbi:MAG: hypothetical protein IJR82_00170 [Bacilli bacterium]|nr:hypothetical protein [Bacilli bacterium]
MFNKCCFNRPMGCCMPQTCGQIVEPPINKCIEKEFYHEVPHVCPIHTHVINRHIYRHTYTPQYSCSEENQVINNDCGSCAQFQ